MSSVEVDQNWFEIESSNQSPFCEPIKGSRQQGSRMCSSNWPL